MALAGTARANMRRCLQQECLGLVDETHTHTHTLFATNSRKPMHLNDDLLSLQRFFM